MCVCECVCSSDRVCFTCYFSLILMALQGARHFNRAKEKLVKHTHTRHKTERRLARLRHGRLAGVCVCVCAHKEGQPG